MELPFLNPWMLLALPAAGVPIVIHLLNRHRVKTIEWLGLWGQLLETTSASILETRTAARDRRFQNASP